MATARRRSTGTTRRTIRTEQESVRQIVRSRFLPSRRGTSNRDGSVTLTLEGPTDPRASALFEWWMHTAFDDFVATVPKMLEYGGESETRPGSADLRVVGEGLMELLGWPVNESTEAVAQELGCWFYLLGKSGRLISNYQQRKPGKEDTWFDIGIYAKMARRIQETGQWP